MVCRRFNAAQSNGFLQSNSEKIQGAVQYAFACQYRNDFLTTNDNDSIKILRTERPMRLLIGLIRYSATVTIHYRLNLLSVQNKPQRAYDWALHRSSFRRTVSASLVGSTERLASGGAVGSWKSSALR